MEVINARAALLSNFEVLTHLRELEHDHLARMKAAQHVKKEEESSVALGSVVSGNKGPAVVEVSENLRTVEIEAIQHLSADFQPTSSQNPESITQLAKDLASCELTKAEKLQIVNLAPTTAVELYVFRMIVTGKLNDDIQIIEELEDRLGDRMEDILALVRTSLRAPASPSNETRDTEFQYAADEVHPEEWIAYGDADIDALANVIEFDDTGEGVGVEGDLDVDDD